jgi:hypothetical protein
VLVSQEGLCFMELVISSFLIKFSNIRFHGQPFGSPPLVMFTGTETVILVDAPQKCTHALKIGGLGMKINLYSLILFG